VRIRAPGVSQLIRVLDGRISDPANQRMASGVRLTALLFGVALATTVEGESLEWRPMLGGGYSSIVEPHGALSAAMRLQLSPRFFFQPEYLVLPAAGHTDHGPTFLLGVSGTSPNALRPFGGVGGGPVRGYQGDNGIFYVALGASYPVAREHAAFLQGEVRYGVLGESTYSQVSVAVGISR
jgi:hypothetical protein